tara:strand:+ start:425 stop:601 length:177 start_codon:yes stop_codon:yes gene_type:complete
MPKKYKIKKIPSTPKPPPSVTSESQAILLGVEPPPPPKPIGTKRPVNFGGIKRNNNRR